MPCRVMWGCRAAPHRGAMGGSDRFLALPADDEGKAADARSRPAVPALVAPSPAGLVAHQARLQGGVPAMTTRRRYRPRPLDLASREGLAQAFDWTAWHAPAGGPLGDLAPAREHSLKLADFVLELRAVGEAAIAAELERRIVR